MQRKIAFILIFLLSAWCVAAHALDAHVYDSRGKRDPFVPLVGDISKIIESLEDIDNIEDVVLQGTAIEASGKRVAILNGETVTEDETRGHITIKEISRTFIVLTIDKEEHTLSIYGEGFE